MPYITICERNSYKGGFKENDLKMGLATVNKCKDNITKA